MGSAFTLTLANIFMWKWETVLVRRQQVSTEIYGRQVFIVQDSPYHSNIVSSSFLDILMISS